MNVLNNLIDDQWPFEGYDHIRLIGRAIVFNDEGKIALCHVVRDDAFGSCNYVETPGGGIEENEELSQGVIRELEEEIGYECEVIEELGVVNDFYNKIKRKNENHYFLCHTLKEKEIHHESSGDDLIKDIYWVDIEEAIGLYLKMKDTGLEVLVKRRELPILLLVKELIKEASKRNPSQGVN